MRDCDTVEVFPHSVSFPKLKRKDHLKQATTDIVALLTQPPSSTVPALKEGDPTRNVLLTFTQRLNRTDNMLEPTSNPENVNNTVSPPRVNKVLSKAPPPRVPSDISLQLHEEHAPVVMPCTN